MAVIFWDSFDHKSPDKVTEFYDAGSACASIVAGRTGNAGTISNGILDVFQHLDVSFSGRNDVTIHRGCRMGLSSAIGSIRNAGLPHVYVQMNADRTLSVIRFDDGSPEVTLFTSDDETQLVPMETDRPFHLGFRAIIHPSAGQFWLWVDGDLWAHNPAVNTSSDGSEIASRVRFTHNHGGSPDDARQMIDDVLITDNDNSVPGQETMVNYLGAVKIASLLSSGNGFTNEWGYGGAATSQVDGVDDANGENGDDDYTKVKEVGLIQLFNMANLDFTQRDIDRIVGVGSNQFFSREDMLYREVQALIRTNAINYEGSIQAPSFNDYQRLSTVKDKNPNTLRDWLVNEVNNVQLGARLNV